MIAEEVFWSRVTRPDDAGDSCWTWAGTVYKGYGRYGGAAAHRVAYELVIGAIPAGLEVDHLCSNPLCVKPSHLEPVTRRENNRRRSVRQTRCKHGHEFTPENTYYYVRSGQVHRTCRACNRRNVAAYSARRAGRAS